MYNDICWSVLDNESNLAILLLINVIVLFLRFVAICISSGVEANSMYMFTWSTNFSSWPLWDKILANLLAICNAIIGIKVLTAFLIIFLAKSLLAFALSALFLAFLLARLLFLNKLAFFILL